MGTSALSRHKNPHGRRRAKKTEAKLPVSRRTTISLSAESVEIVERFRRAAGLSMSEAISELIERFDEQPARIKWVDGLPVADISPIGKWITTEEVLRAEAEPW